ncbi:MAG: glycoside hydrolase family 113, partial [Candidatus Acidiferrales bacterium]
MRRGLRFLFRLSAATAASLLGLLAVTFAGDAARLLLALLGAARFEGIETGARGWSYSLSFLPRLTTSFPPDGPGLLYAVYAGAPLLAAFSLLGLSVWRARRAGDWARIFWMQVAVWTSIPLLLQSGVFFRWPRGSVGAALRGLWPEAAASTPVRVAVAVGIAVPLLFALISVARRLLDAAAEGRAVRMRALSSWILLPALLTSLLLNLPVLRFRSWWVGVVIFGPALLAVLIGIVAALSPRRPAPEMRWNTVGAVALLTTLALVLGLSFAARPLLQAGGRAEFTEVQSQHWRLYLEAGAAAGKDAEDFAAKADARLENIAQRLGLRPPNPQLTAYCYSSAGLKSARTGDDRPFTLKAESKTVHHLLAPGGSPSDARGDALLLLEINWGEPASPAIADALARFAVGDFHGHALGDYAGRVTREEGAWSLREIFVLTGDYHSSLVRDALGGAWVESQVSERGRSVLPLLYRAPLAPDDEEEFAAALGTHWDALEKEWREYLAARAAAPVPRAPAAPAPPAFQRGISFSHEVGGNFGYGSDRAAQELERIRGLGANAVAVVPYAFTRAPAEASIFTATDESDDRVVRTIEAAHQLGLATMLKPQLWGSGFTGDIVFARPADFERWFERYRRWLLHMARLAELHRVEVLVIGTELGGLTGHEAAWRGLIADLRRVYSGRLTYAAHWGGEFENLPFWDALDFLGVNLYYPLAAPGQFPRADSPRVRALVQKLAGMAEKHRKPILFTEVGYPSLSSAAAEPWKEGEAGLDLE